MGFESYGWVAATGYCEFMSEEVHSDREAII